MHQRVGGSLKNKESALVLPVSLYDFFSCHFKRGKELKEI
jgi:hypothetical protein